MSEDILKQSESCDLCQTEFRRNQAIIAYGAEFPDKAKKHNIEEDEEVTLCPDCGKKIKDIDF